MKWKCSWISVIGTYFSRARTGFFSEFQENCFYYRCLTTEIFQPIFGTSKSFFCNIPSGLQLYYKWTPKQVFSVKFVCFFVEFLRTVFLWTPLLAAFGYYFGFQVSVWFFMIESFSNEANILSWNQTCMQGVSFVPWAWPISEHMKFMKHMFIQNRHFAVLKVWCFPLY